MRLALRALLLATGCLVMVATSPSHPPDEGPSTWYVPAGGTLELVLSATGSDGGPFELPPLITLHVQQSTSPNATTPAAPPRLVGFVSSTLPPLGTYDRLDPKATFTEGQQVEDVGTVHLVRSAPLSLGFGEPGDDALRLSAPGTAVFSLYSPDADVVVDLYASLAEMEARCQCRVMLGIGTYPPRSSPPDAGTGGGDGG